MSAAGPHVVALSAEIEESTMALGVLRRSLADSTARVGSSWDLISASNELLARLADGPSTPAGRGAPGPGSDRGVDVIRDALD